VSVMLQFQRAVRLGLETLHPHGAARMTAMAMMMMAMMILMRMTMMRTMMMQMQMTAIPGSRSSWLEVLPSEG